MIVNEGQFGPDQGRSNCIPKETESDNALPLFSVTLPILHLVVGRKPTIGCNEQYCGHVIKAQPSFHDGKDMSDINELPMNRKYGQSVTTDDRRTFTKVSGADKDKVSRDQTLGNDNKDAMLDCKSGFHQSEDKRT